MNYGPGAEYTIDTMWGYHVRTQFMASVDATGEPLDLVAVVTTITQDDRTVELVQDCEDYLAAISWKLYYQMNIGISTYALDLDNQVSNSTCSAACDGGNLYIGNLNFVSNDSLVIDEDGDEGEDGDEDLGELIWEDAAFSLDSGECGSNCAECRWSYPEFAPDLYVERCFEQHENNIRFGGPCWRRDDKSTCMEDGLCHRSWYNDDADKWNSLEAKCRTVPESYVENDFTYGNRECRRPDKAGLCRYGCGEGETCNNSWLSDDDNKWKSASAMCRCRPAEDD